MTENKWTSEKLLEMKKDGAEEARVRLYSTFPDTGERIALTVSLPEVEE